MIDKDKFVAHCRKIRAQSPLIHCITNYVAMEFNANSLLAIGASPLMSFCPEEMEEISSSSAALCINIGCIGEELMRAARIAAAKQPNWVLDPVGVGISRIRKDFCRELISSAHPKIIRGNASEILCLSGSTLAPGRVGVDTKNESGQALEAARSLAQSSGSTVVVSGATDYITDGTRFERISFGSPLMGRITAMGCTASALCAAFLTVADPFTAACEAMLLTSLAGQQAAQDAPGPGTMKERFTDCLFNYVR